MKRLVIVVLCLLTAGLSLANAANPASHGSLTKGDPLAKAIERLATVWGDENITSSGLQVRALFLKPTPAELPGQLQTLNEELLRTLYKFVEYEDLPAVKLETTVKPFAPEAVKIAAELVSDEGFVYDPKNVEGRKANLLELTRGLKPLGLTAGRDLVAITHTRVKHDDEWKNLNLILFLNVQTQKAVCLYVREGSM